MNAVLNAVQKGINYLKHPLVVAIIILLIYLSPFYIFGENAYISIWDNMCYVIPYLLAKSNLLFAGMRTILPNVMNGIPRDALPSEFNVVVMLFHFFPFYIAHAINQTIIRITGLVGMYLLLDRHAFKKSGNKLIVAGVSLAYAMVKVSPLDGLTILGLPLVMYAFLNIREKRQNVFDWLIILLVPFYSFFVVSYIFVIFLLGLLWIYDVIRNREINYRFILALVLMTIVFMMVEYRLVYLLLFDKSFVSHRVEFSFTSYSLFDCIFIFLSAFLVEQPTIAGFHLPYIVLSVVLAYFIASKYKISKTTMTASLMVIFSFYLIGSLSYWEGLGWLKSHFKIFNAFNSSRFIWLEPFVWYVVFAFSLDTIMKGPKFGKKVVLFLLIAQIAFLFTKSDFVQEKTLFNITYKQFYSEKLFADIKNYIGKDVSTYRVVSIGLHPAIAQYNGFYTVDAYINDYPLEYKHKFRRIIEKELRKGGPGVRLLRFDSWGNLCYTYVDEVGYNYTINKNSRLKIRHLDLNTKALKDLGGKYIFSTAEILNYKQNNLEFLKSFDDKDSAWKIYLYKCG